ncbi:DnaJ domain-containing protein [bacterium]|nr:DnaJ domain-containing protein [bacterium]
MSVKFQDYYKTLGVERGASADEIKKAFKKLARKYHPDINKESGAEDRFKEVNEAYEVLGDAEKRKQYDALGANWKNGQEFRPPPNWEEVFGSQFRGGGGQYGGFQQQAGARPGGASFSFEQGAGGFSDFFESIFGGGASFQHQAGGGASPFGSSGFQQRAPQKGGDLETEVTITLEEGLHGAKKQISFDLISTDPQGGRQKERKSYQVKVPAGIQSGKTIRLAGQGAPSPQGGENGDLRIKVHIAPHPRFLLKGKNVEREIKLTPWEAALGAEIPVETIDGTTVSVKVPPSSQSGQKLRLRGKGYVEKGERGDLFAVLKIAVPKELSTRERELFVELQESSSFNPRASS